MNVDLTSFLMLLEPDFLLTVLLGLTFFAAWRSMKKKKMTLETYVVQHGREFLRNVAFFSTFAECINLVVLATARGMAFSSALSRYILICFAEIAMTALFTSALAWMIASIWADGKFNWKTEKFKLFGGLLVMVITFFFGLFVTMEIHNLYLESIGHMHLVVDFDAWFDYRTVEGAAEGVTTQRLERSALVMIYMTPAFNLLALAFFVLDLYFIYGGGADAKVVFKITEDHLKTMGLNPKEKGSKNDANRKKAETSLEDDEDATDDDGSDTSDLEKELQQLMGK